MNVEDLVNALAVFTFGFGRMFACFTMIPIFQATVLPGGIRTGLAAVMTLPAYPIIAPDGMVLDFSTLTLVVLAVKEVIIGILLGFGAAMIFYAIETAGFFIDNQRGSTMASSVNPLTGSQTSPLGIFLSQVLNVVFMVGGGFFVLMLAIYESYRFFPVFEFYPVLNMEGTLYFLSIIDAIMALGILVAAPAMIAMFLSEFGLGLISRFAPQLNVFFLAMPVKSAVGILMLVLYMQLLQVVWEDAFADIATHFTIMRGLLQ